MRNYDTTMNVKPTLSKIRISCGVGGASEVIIPTNVVNEIDLKDWLNTLGVGVFDVTVDIVANQLIIKQIDGTCKVDFLLNGAYVSCNVAGIPVSRDCLVPSSTFNFSVGNLPQPKVFLFWGSGNDSDGSGQINSMTDLLTYMNNYLPQLGIVGAFGYDAQTDTFSTPKTPDGDCKFFVRY